MTPKELMYLEDSLGMEQQLQTKCNDYASKVQDESLRNALLQFANNCLCEKIIIQLFCFSKHSSDVKQCSGESTGFNVLQTGLTVLLPQTCERNR